jgi:hypothetical protein
MKSHGARKTFGTIMLEFGYSIESVSKMMGHSNPLITAQIYSKVTQAKIEREMQRTPTAEGLEDLHQRLSEVENSVDNLHLPIAFSDQLYVLREHINLVRQRFDSMRAA